MNRSLLVVLLSALSMAGVAVAADITVINRNGVNVYKITQQWGLCSAVQFHLKKPTQPGQKIKLEARRFCSEQDNQWNGEAELNTMSDLTQEVQWTGHGDCQYNVYVKLITPANGIRLDSNGQLVQQNSALEEYVNADEWVSVTNYKNNVGCVLGIGGPNAPKEPLNLIIKPGQ